MNTQKETALKYKSSKRPFSFTNIDFDLNDNSK